MVVVSCCFVEEVECNDAKDVEANVNTLKDVDNPEPVENAWLGHFFR